MLKMALIMSHDTFVSTQKTEARASEHFYPTGQLSQGHSNGGPHAGHIWPNKGLKWP